MAEETVKIRIAFDPHDRSLIGTVQEVSPADARQKIRDGWAVRVDDDAVDEPPTPYAGTIAEVLAVVADDPAKAREALAYEQTQTKPRPKLIEQLEAIAATEPTDELHG